MKVPFLDLHKHHEPHRGEISEVLNSIIEKSAFVGGSAVDDFEQQFAAYCGAKEAVGVGSGTDALWLSLLALGVGAGDEVITSPMTFVATVEAIVRVGARPVFVDIDPMTYTLDVSQVPAAITPKTKAVIPVHLYGKAAEMDALLKVAEEHEIFVVEDAAQSHGAVYQGKRVGTMGATGCFSFYPGKNLGAMGEGGAVTTNDSFIADRIRSLANHGQTQKYQHQSVGWNCRLDSFQAAILQIKLRNLDENNDLRRAHAVRYDAGLHGVDGMILPTPSREHEHVYHLYVIRVSQRDHFIAKMKAVGVDCGIHYPVPVHLLEAYVDLGYQAGSFPVSESYAGDVVSLPMFPELTEVQVDYVVEKAREVLAECAAA